MKILVVDDDVKLANLIRRGLTEAGHTVDIEYDGVEGERAAAAGAYDAIVLDVMLPSSDGIAVARSLRAARIATPILMLTARDTEADTISGLDAGADDYLRKPFAFGELFARLRALVRREPGVPQAGTLRVGDVVLDLASRRVKRGERPIELTARESAFLEYFMRRPGHVVTRRMLEDALWERDRDTISNVIEVYVRRLRAKLGANGEGALLHTVRGAGYRFDG